MFYVDYSQHGDFGEHVEVYFEIYEQDKKKFNLLRKFCVAGSGGLAPEWSAKLINLYFTR